MDEFIIIILQQTVFLERSYLHSVEKINMMAKNNKSTEVKVGRDWLPCFIIHPVTLKHLS